MKNDNVAVVLNLLKRTHMILVDGKRYISDWCIDNGRDNPENELLHFSWEEDGYACSTAITVSGITDGEIIGNKVMCTDYEGDDITFECFTRIAPAQASGYNAAILFFTELTDSVESLAAIDSYLLAHLFYLQTAILKNSTIEVDTGLGDVIYALGLPSYNTEWVKYITEL